MIYFTSVEWMLKERGLTREYFAKHFFTIKDKELSNEVLRYETIGCGHYITNSVNDLPVKAHSLYKNNDIYEYIPKWGANIYPYIMLVRELS